MVKVDKERLAVGSVILHYRIEQVLGQGGFGITYLAEDLRDQTRVAIKEYFPRSVAMRTEDGRVRAKSSMADEVQQFEWGLDRFRKEVLTLAKFDHDNIVPVLYFFDALDTVYMVMPYVEGETLEVYLAQNPGMTESELLEWAIPLLNGLEQMHRVGYLHRDIKPANIIIRKNGCPMLLDFGATRQAMDSNTIIMTIVLTPGYAPIEQSYQDSKRQGPWTDIFSIGAVLYHAITGSPPCPATERIMAISGREQDPLPSLIEVGRGQYREDFLWAIEHAMRLSEKDRPQTVEEWKKELLGEKKPPRYKTVSTDDDTDQKQKTEQNIKYIVTDTVLDKVTETNGNSDFRHVGTDDAAVKGQETGQYIAVDIKEASARLRGRRVLVGVGVLFGVCLIGLAGTWMISRQEALGRFSAQAPETADTSQTAKETHDAFVRGNESYGRQDYKEAEKWFRKAADQGHIAAQSNLGAMYYWGQLVPQDYKEAEKWFRKAADQGHPIAQSNLGTLYFQGNGISKDEQEAAKWWHKAAEQGDADTQYFLGKYTVMNDKEAATWYRKAAEQGYAQAQFELGLRYQNGQGVPQSAADAEQWYRKAAEKEHVGAKEMLLR